MSRLNCDLETLEATKLEYFRNGGREGTHQRLGQYIWNRHGADGKSFSELFYAENPRQAIELAYAEIGAFDNKFRM